MKQTLKRWTAALAAVCLLCTQAPGASAFTSDQTIDIETPFDYIMQYVEWFSLGAENEDVLRQYFNKYFEQYPEDFVDLVHSIMQSIDEYSMYLSPEEYSWAFEDPIAEYGGVGATLVMDGDMVVIEDVYRSGPGYEAGLRAGDIVLAIGGMDTTGLDNGAVSLLLRGEPGSEVEITVRRGAQELTFRVTRRVITPEHVYSETLSPGIEYVRVSSMLSDEDDERFAEIWRGLAAKQTKAAILDLRGNGGGLVDMALHMVDSIVPEKDVKYMTLRYREDDGGEEDYYTSGSGLKLNSVIVLIDGSTASSAEIVAGALSDAGAAILVGEPTYGKGVGQYHFTMPDGSRLILTALQMVLPKTGTYNGTGIVPDFHIGPGETVSVETGVRTLRVDQILFPGQQSAQVAAMTERLTMLGYLPNTTDVFDAGVLEGLRKFQIEHGILPSLLASPVTLQRLSEKTGGGDSSLLEMDQQLATAYEMSRIAAEKPLQYTVHENGTWTNH